MNASPYAGWVRLAAIVIDTIIFALITIPAAMVVYGLEYLESTELVRGPADFLISWVFPALFTILCWMTFAATPGKLIVGIRVVDAATWEKLSFAQCVIRYVGYFVSALVIFLGYLWVMWHPRKQGWHDLLAKSVVIKRGVVTVSRGGPPPIPLI